MSDKPAVKAENLTKLFRNKSLWNFPYNRRSVMALDNLELEIDRGEIFGYLGPNGAGKTTTFKLLLGLIFPTSGTAWVLGRNIRDIKYKRDVGFLPEQPYFYDYLTAEEFLNFYAQLFRFDKKTRRHKVQSILKKVGLEESASRQLRKFSRGMLQRIGIAQALINDPELVILDEPLSGLDPIGRKEIRDIILHLRNEGRTVVFSSHILSDVEAVCDRVGILVKGKLKRVERLDEFRDFEVESVEITAYGLNEASREAIRSLGGQVVHNSNRTVITAHCLGFPEGEEMIGSILVAIREFGGRLVSVTSRNQSLEDLFVKLSTGVADEQDVVGRKEAQDDALKVLES